MLMPIIWFLLKTVVFCFIYVWFRAALPRLRYDQLMDLGWKRLIPLTLGWLLLVAGSSSRLVAGSAWSPLSWPVVLLASCLAHRAIELDGRSDGGLVVPAIGRRVDAGAAADARRPSPTGGDG